MGELRHRVGKLLMRIGIEGIPNRAALCEAVREARRAFVADRVPDWLVVDLLADCERSGVLANPEPAVEFWYRLRLAVNRVLSKHLAEPLPDSARIHGSELYWLSGPPPRALLRALRRTERLVNIEAVPADEARDHPADERLLVLPAAIAIDAIPSVRALSERVPLTGIVVTGTGVTPSDAALLVLGPATGVPVWGKAARDDGADYRRLDPGEAARLLLGDLRIFTAPRTLGLFLSGSPPGQPTPLDDLYHAFDRLLRGGMLRLTLSMMPGVVTHRVGWTLQRLEREVHITHAILGAMTEKERNSPLGITEERRIRIAEEAGVPVGAVKRFLDEYLDRMRRGG